MRFAYGITAAETTAQAQTAQMALMSVLAAEDREDNIQALTPNRSLM
jgi:hypothetical protein